MITPPVYLSPLISAVMPAYNAALYIKEAIESILSQDFDCFELIVADDCSTDNTVEIVEAFNDSRIRLIKTPMNTGSAKYPRELAIEAARAPYICWVDSDDTIPTDYLTSLYARKIATGADIVCSQMYAERDGELEYMLPAAGFDFDTVLSGRDAIKLTLDFPWLINLNGWLCNRSLWCDISTFKSLTINHMDADDFSAREMLFKSDKVAFCPVPYYYRLHPDAITKKITRKKFESVITDRLVFDFLKENLPEAVHIEITSLCRRMVSMERLYMIHRKNMSTKESSEIHNLLKDYFSRITLSDILRANISLPHKLLLLLPFNLSLLVVKHLN